ncbi:hypothetical protein PANT_25d00053 [Moesziomyces antarcticus T-34]|uniref:SOK1 protein n=1 Tax=Pseudozyma antarctica (strain T-34) TaxID=1151754 RepID=M9MIS3_PSEA3|nr:hypothetical protein PANT_25d00053 [Moesziomyces antarcticus T-34]
MDASADDPQRFRIRRSPSIGTSAAAVGPASTRSGKRKLSTAAFASSPSMAPHPPSSPITSEHPTDELKLKQGIQTASQATSTSRSTVDASDATSSNAESSSAAAAHPNASASHAQFHEWQDQRRCHSVLADYDYLHSTEDRRDPRSSNARLVMPVSQQSQTVACSSAHDRPASEMESHTSLQPPPIALQHDDDSANDGTCDTAPSHTGLGPSASLPLSPECNVSPSPSFAAYGYPDTPPHVSQRLSSSLSQDRPGTASASTSASASSHRLSSIAESSNERTGPTDACSTNHTASETSRPWTRATSLRFDQAEQRERSPLGEATHNASQSPDPFRLQPVPPSKRRKLDDSLAGATHAGLGTPARIDDARRSSDAGIASDSAQVRNSVDKKAGEALFEDKPGFLNHTQRAALVPSAQPTAPASLSVARTSSAHAARLDQSTDARNAAHAPATSKHNAHAEAIQRKQHAWPSREYSRLTRAHSVPNLRAKATLDVSAPSHHRLILPSHLAGYVSSQSRQSRSGQNGSKGSTMRLSKGLPLNLAHYSVGTSSSRSRSTFTPTLHPPITRHTLRELDLLEILKNPQLRHDVVFDPNVQFRPNFDGERGRRKREAGERYWAAVVREIETGCTCTAFSHGQLLPCTCRAKGRSLPAGAACLRDAAAGLDGKRDSKGRPPLPNSRIPSRIPLLVQELRTICLSILPSNYPADSAGVVAEEASATSTDDSKVGDEATSGRDSMASGKAPAPASSGVPSLATTHHQLIAHTLDPHLIAQELQHGVLDVPALITFMGSILKLHCAPMRDEAIEKMVEVVCIDHDIGKGLRLCFEILELMKLDIANHQLRSARPFLVETAVDFEIRWFKEQIEQGKMSLDKTTAWMRQALSEASDDSGLPRSQVMVTAFNRGMLQLIFDVPGTLPVLSQVATPLGSPSSSSLNNTFATLYPETFQFDAYRMMTFHNDVSDLTIVYMLLLLFRQLCGTPLDDGAPLPACVGSLVQRQLKSIKGEIWCLLNDANLAVQTAAPSAKTQQLLNSWMETNLRSGSALHKICQSRLRDVVLGMLTDKVRSSLPIVAALPVAASKGGEPSAMQQKRASSSEDGDADDGASASKRHRTDAGSDATSSDQVANTAGVAAGTSTPWDAAMSRAGLEPFAAEIRLLSDRVAKVATFHLRVFRHLYEGFEAGRAQAAQQPSPSS